MRQKTPNAPNATEQADMTSGAQQIAIAKACPDLFVHVTAAQRAEAFLRTLDLWDDTK